MKSFKIKVIDRTWTIKLWDPHDYHAYSLREGYGNTFGLTHTHDRSIHLPLAKYINLDTIRHELWHAYSYELCIYSTEKMTKDNMEEIYCDFFAKYGKVYLKQGTSIERTFKKELKSI